MAEKETQEKKQRRPRKEREETSRLEKTADEFVDRVVHVNRVSKTVKGGHIARFAALMVVGDGAGHVGFGLGKAAEVPEAIRKGIEGAK